MILNAVLLKYVGVAIPIGRDILALEQAKWKETTVRAAEYEQMDEEMRGEKGPWKELSTLVLLQAHPSLKGLDERLKMADSEHGGSRKPGSFMMYYWGVEDNRLTVEADRNGRSSNFGRVNV